MGRNYLHESEDLMLFASCICGRFSFGPFKTLRIHMGWVQKRHQERTAWFLSVWRYGNETYVQRVRVGKLQLDKQDKLLKLEDLSFRIKASSYINHCNKAVKCKFVLQSFKQTA